MSKKRQFNPGNVPAVPEAQTTTASLTAEIECAPYRLARRRTDQEHERAVQSQKRGKIGYLFGDAGHAAVYAISLIVLLVLLALMSLAFIDAGLRADVSDLLGKMALTALGFLGGLLSKLGR